MAKKTIEERLGYLGLDPEDLKLLAELRPVLEAHVDDIVEAFHRQLLLFPETRRLFLEPHAKERFVAGRRHYMLSLADTHFGDDYLRERERSAVTQERAGLGPEWTIRLAVLYFTLLAPIVGREFSHDLEKLTRIVTALAARMALDVEVAVESYIERHEQGLAYLADELARQSRILQRTPARAGRGAPADHRARARGRGARVDRHARGRARARDRHPDVGDPGARQDARGQRRGRRREVAAPDDPGADRAHLADHPHAARDRASAPLAHRAGRARAAARPDIGVCFRALGAPRRAREADPPAVGLGQRRPRAPPAAVPESVPERRRRDARRRRAARGPARGPSPGSPSASRTRESGSPRPTSSGSSSPSSPPRRPGTAAGSA